MADSERARRAFDEHSALERARDALAGALREPPPTPRYGYPVAAAIAAVAQAEALDRIAAALEAIAGCVDVDGPVLVVRQQGDPLADIARLATVLEEAHA
jgi:hypothetical protein